MQRKVVNTIIHNKVSYEFKLKLLHLFLNLKILPSSHFSGITKKVLQASKESGNEKLLIWLKGIRSHLYWCAMSTKQGFGELIVAKWKSLMRHICNKHTDHPDAIFDKCAHGPLEKRDWLKTGKKQTI